MSTQEIPESLFEDGWLDGIEHVISSGKEGTVWCCSCAESSRIDSDYVAVKVYRPRSTRSFKNDSIYVQGRSFGVALSGATGIARSAGAPDQRLNRAIKNRSRIGKMAGEDSWTHHEFATLTSLYQAGAHVPRPYTSTNRAIVMEYLGEPDAPAPKLKEVELGIDEAYAVFRLLIEEIELWLSYERIHGDLSPFNILYWREKVPSSIFRRRSTPTRIRSPIPCSNGTCTTSASTSRTFPRPAIHRSSPARSGNALCNCRSSDAHHRRPGHWGSAHLHPGDRRHW